MSILDIGERLRYQFLSVQDDCPWIESNLNHQILGLDAISEMVKMTFVCLENG